MTPQFRWFNLMTLSLAALLFSTASCEDKEDDDAPKVEYSLSGNATGAQEVPAVTTPGTGTVSGTYNTSNNTLNYTVNWANVKANPSAMHFHGPARPGENASPVINITSFPMATTGSKSGTETLTEAQEADLMNGLWYYNLHTPAPFHPTGEIRAQVIVQ